MTNSQNSSFLDGGSKLPCAKASLEKIQGITEYRNKLGRSVSLLESMKDICDVTTLTQHLTQFENFEVPVHTLS